MKKNVARGEICFLPRFGPQDQGGVAVHIRCLREQLAQRGWTIVETPGPDTLIHAHAMARASSVHVYTNHGIYPFADKMPAWQRSANAAIFENLKLAEEVVAVSRWTASRWSKLVGRTPHIIYNAVDPAQWAHLRPGYWRGRLSIPTQIPIAVWGKTSLSDVLDPSALVELALRHPDWRFITPLPTGALPSLIKNLICVGRLSFEAMQYLLADCDVYLATVQENHSIQVLEALAAGKPVLGYDWGGTAETLRSDGQIVGGQLVAPHDHKALVDALGAVYDARRELGAQGQAHVRAHFSLSQQIDQLEQVYEMTTVTQKRNHGPYEMNPKCSIVIPVYNKQDWIAETVTSARRQVQAPKYEIIVVNDGSTDDSLLTARRAADNDPKVRVYDIPNGGVAAARNFGISHAKGEYICCLDADDMIDPHFLQRLSAALDADPGLGVAYSDFLVFGTDNRGMPFESGITCDEYDFDKLKRGNIMPCCNLFRKVAWQRAGGYKAINPSWEDYELWLNMGKLGWYGRRVPGLLFKYRKVPKVGRDFESHGLEWKLRAIVNSYHRDLYDPLVSFIVPCYEHSQFLATALDSIVAQTFPDWEVIVIDDGNVATEAAQISAIVEGYASPNVRLVRHATNQGLASARNTGVETARGTWIVPLDADDKLAPRFLEQVLKASEFNQQRFVYTDAFLWWPDEEPERTQLLAAHDYDFDESLQRITWACSILYAKKAWREVGGYKPQMSGAGGWEDWEFVLSLGENGVCGVRVPEALFYYRQHSNQQMRLKAESNKPFLQELLRRLHAEIYRGERPAMCCGAGRKTRSPVPTTAPVTERSIPPVALTTAESVSPDVILRYTGNRAGTQTYVGPSGRRYRFGLNEPLQKVAANDVTFLLDSGVFTRVTT